MSDSTSKMTAFDPSMVSIDPSLFASNVDRRPFPLRHQLADHPLFRLENLIDLARRLPVRQREYVFAKQSFGSHDSLAQYNHAAENDETSTAELIERIEEQNIVIVLRNIESDPVYGEFVNNCLDSLSNMVESITGSISERESFVFISPPRAYTPYHYDPEQNFYLHLRGEKQMAIYDVHDRNVLSEQALEKYYSEGQLITRCSDDMFDSCEVFDMNPGDGVYVPVTAPHWVRTLDEITVSVSINFRTPSSIRRDRVYRANRLLRRLGLNPGQVSPHADRLSEYARSTMVAFKEKLGRVIG